MAGEFTQPVSMVVRELPWSVSCRSPFGEIVTSNPAGDREFKTANRRRDNLYREAGHALPPPGHKARRQHHVSADAKDRCWRGFEAPEHCCS